jgi:hypothetical protein
MDELSDPLFEKIHAYAVGLLEGTLSSPERDELAALILSSPEARRVYLEYVQESACLRWLCVEEGPPVVELAAKRHEPSDSSASRGLRKWRIASLILGGGLACVLVAAGVNWWLTGNARNVAASSNAIAVAGPSKAPARSDENKLPTIEPTQADRQAVATITSLGGARWQLPAGGGKILQRCAIGDRLRLREGSAQLTFDAGAQVTVFGPADFDITSATSIKCRRGRVTALVDHRGKGFWIETPQAKVIDIGTQFGLSISEKGETEVVVFQGAIDLSYSARAKAADVPNRRMQQGDALVLKNSGEIERLMSVERNNFMSSPRVPGLRPTEPVIADVRDNIRKADSIKSYQIVRGGLDEDVLAFVDRNHQWNGVDHKGMPPFLVGADYIMPFNDDKFVPGLELSVRLLRPATLYVFLDTNMIVPEWLRKDFKDTGLDIGLDCSKTEWHKDHTLGAGPGRSIDFRFAVWKRDVKEAETVTLGGIEQPPAIRSQGFNMYGIAAVAGQ